MDTGLRRGDHLPTTASTLTHSRPQAAQVTGRRHGTAEPELNEGARTKYDRRITASSYRNLRGIQPSASAAERSRYRAIPSSLTNSVTMVCLCAIQVDVIEACKRAKRAQLDNASRLYLARTCGFLFDSEELDLLFIRERGNL